MGVCQGHPQVPGYWTRPQGEGAPAGSIRCFPSSLTLNQPQVYARPRPREPAPRLPPLPPPLPPLQSDTACPAASGHRPSARVHWGLIREADRRPSPCLPALLWSAFGAAPGAVPLHADAPGAPSWAPRPGTSPRPFPACHRTRESPPVRPARLLTRLPHGSSGRLRGPQRPCNLH